MVQKIKEKKMAIKKKITPKANLVKTIERQDKVVSLAADEIELLLAENKTLRAQVNHLLALVNILTRH